MRPAAAALLFLDRFWRDVRHSLRVFTKNPAFTGIAVLSIAFGTGANVALFSAADALILRPLPVERPAELVTIRSRIRTGWSTRYVASYSDYLDIRDRTHSFDGIVAFTSREAAFSAQPGTTPQVKVVTMVSGSYFHVL